MNDPERRTDEELAAELARGDASAGDDLVRRHALDVFDFAVRTVLDIGVAMAVTTAAFERARAEAGQRPASIAFRPWLFGLARSEAFEGLRQRGQPAAPRGASRGTAPLSPLDERFVQPASPDTDKEAAVWSWQAARGQRPRDYSLLDLSLRRRLTPSEVADVAGLSRTGVYAVLGRLRGAFEEGYAASALYSRGRSSCNELDELVKGSGPELRAAVRWEMVRHSEACLTCRETLATLPAAADLFVSLLEVEPPAELASQLLAADTAPFEAALAALDAPSVPDEPAAAAEEPDIALSDEAPPEETLLDEEAADVAPAVTGTGAVEPPTLETALSPPPLPPFLARPPVEELAPPPAVPETDEPSIDENDLAAALGQMSLEERFGPPARPGLPQEPDEAAPSEP
jgi:DNA-directed RNA polymerase specialized sigma24 family protein